VSFIKALYFNRRLFVLITSICVVFLLAFIFPLLLDSGKVLAGTVTLLLLVDCLLLFTPKTPVFARREMTDKLSNGDDNAIAIFLINRYTFSVQLEIIDEIPFQFQKRDLLFRLSMKTNEEKKLLYLLHPVKRGVYEFGAVNVYCSTIIGLAKRRFRLEHGRQVAVYPSFLQMRKYDLLAISNRMNEQGMKKIRKIGHSTEFETIRTYAPGDDPRAINWKATARRSHLMVNNYQDEISQSVYCIIDKGRVMKMPFEGMSLLDYSINASLALANAILRKNDKAGLITFSKTVSTWLPAARKISHMETIMRFLYKEKTNFLESDFDTLFANIRKQITQRSLLILFTNFESVVGMRKQLSYLRNLSKNHLLLIVFFENTELVQLLESQPKNLEDIYTKTVAEKFAYDKRLIVKELNAYGIHALLTPPNKLTINVLNKYLEFKTRGLI
jgi:uncharacterized protein (DUF58 family)